jgi:hypothetical protein
MTMFLSVMVVPYQNCGHPTPVEFLTESSHSDNQESLSFLLSASSIPKMSGFNPGPKIGEPYACNLEFQAQDLIYKGSISNQIRFNQSPYLPFPSLRYELIVAYGNYLQTDLVSVNSQGAFEFEPPAFDSHVYYYVRVRDPELKVLCTTPVALVSKKSATCSLVVSNSTISPNNTAYFSLRSNLGHLNSSLIGSWITYYNGQLIEAGNQSVSLNNLNYSYAPGTRYGSYSRSLIIRDQMSNAEVCRTPFVAFQALTPEEANRQLSDMSSPNRNSSESIGVPGNGMGGNGMSAEQREWCQSVQTTVQCQVTRTYCTGRAPFQQMVTDQVPIIERHTVTLPKRPMATFLDNDLEFSDKRYRVVRLRSRYFCNPFENPQWQFQSYYGFRCELSVDLRPPNGCDSSGFN